MSIVITSFLETILPNTNNLVDLVSWEDQYQFLDIKLINVLDFSELMIRFGLNTLLIFLTVHFMYGKNSKRKDFYFSFMAIGVIVFLLCFLLNSVKLELGFALGLFAIFGIIRYRTDAIPIKEMTYLFIVIGISVLNALSNNKVSYTELLFTNSVILFGLWLLEKRLMLKQENCIRVIYEKIENVNSIEHDKLLFDLTQRTGIDISRFEIIKIDFLRDVAELDLYYFVNGKNENENKG